MRRIELVDGLLRLAGDSRGGRVISTLAGTSARGSEYFLRKGPKPGDLFGQGCR